METHDFHHHAAVTRPSLHSNKVPSPLKCHWGLCGKASLHPVIRWPLSLALLEWALF